MDIVITYVNGLDPIWQRDYEKHTNQPVLEKRFRDWGTLQYLFRGIAENMPLLSIVRPQASYLVFQIPNSYHSTNLQKNPQTPCIFGYFY